MFITEMHAIGDRCVAVNARIMVTHDATADSIRALLPDFRVRRPMLRTVQALGAMFAFHRQDLRIFGGRHLSAGAVVNRTRVQCPSEFRFCPVMHHERRRTRLYAGTEQIRDGQCGMHGRRRDGSGRRRLFPVKWFGQRPARTCVFLSPRAVCRPSEGEHEIQEFRGNDNETDDLVEHVRALIRRKAREKEREKKENGKGTKSISRFRENKR